MTPAPSGQTTGSSTKAARRWLWAAAILVLVKLWFVSGQTIYALGAAIHDDKLFILLTEHILHGRWLGAYDQFTLAKGPLYSVFMAGNFWLGAPLLLTQQLFYLGACATLVVALRPWLHTAGLRFTLFAVLLLNPMSYDASNLARLMRQSLYTPLALFVIAGLVTVFARRRESPYRLLAPAAGAGLAFGAFWITREESVWLLPAIGLLSLGLIGSLRHELRLRARALAFAVSAFFAAFALPLLALGAMNLSHYGWFGSVEFRAAGFKNAYGALSRIAVGPELPHLIVTRQMREAAYTASPTFALLQPHLEGEIGAHWIERELYPAEDRQIRGGWFMWALRDAHAAAGLAPDAATALRNYQKIADEINAACETGLLPARPPRAGFFPRLTRADIGPLWHETLAYLHYFGTFRGFTAYSPDSVGDYAELKPFRDYAGTHVSHAPRTPDPLPPAQSRLQRFQVASLETAGRLISSLIAWVGPCLLLIGLARTFESMWRRRVTFLFGLAIALFASVTAYLAINILITVTAFKNVSPGAMASAYPLYLIALFALAVDGIQSWSRTVPANRIRPDSPWPSRWRWLLPAGAALLIFAWRLREIHVYGTDVPFNDQWFVEAHQILAPWLDGALRPWTFFLPHFEHMPVWTRLLVWLEVGVTGRWDPFLQMTVNTTLYCLFAWFVARWIWRNFPTSAAGFVTAILILGGALPHAWENTTWGFQSQFPLALLCLWFHVQGTLTHPAGSRRWWLAQAAGAAGLFTLASMWLAPLVVIVAQFWTRESARRAWAIPAFLAAAGVLMLLLTSSQADTYHAFTQTSGTTLDFTRALIRFLGWPSGLPGAAAVLLLPWIIHALRLRGLTSAAAPDRIIFALGLWAIAQAAGLAFARSGAGGDYVSRYGDVFFIGSLAGALALIRLAPVPGHPRRAWLTLALLWTGLMIGGLVQLATTGHARYFHQHAHDNAHIRRVALQAYLEKGDPTLLEQGATRWVLTQNTDAVTALLDRADFRALLPNSIHPANPEYAVGRAVHWLLARWVWCLGAGLLMIIAGLAVLHFRGSLRPALATLPALPRRWPIILCTTTAAASFGSLGFWINPSLMNRDARWHQLLGGDDAIQGMTFDFSQPTEFPPERIVGAAPLGPVELLKRLRGTAPAGPALTCTIFSSAFTVTKDWLIIPYAGYPIGVGNGLRVQLLAPDETGVEREIDCLPPNLEGLGYHAVDLKSVRSRRVRLVLYDGRVDTEAWVAVAPPIPADSPELATVLARRVQAERDSALPLSFAVIGLVALGGAIVAFRRR